MKTVSGSLGPAVMIRSIFSELEKIKSGRPLYLSPKLFSAAFVQLAVKRCEKDVQ